MKITASIPLSQVLTISEINTHKLVRLLPLGNASLRSQRPVGPSESEAKTSSPDTYSLNY